MHFSQDGHPDRSFFSADCFHVSQKAQTMMARSLWNNMVNIWQTKGTPFVKHLFWPVYIFAIWYFYLYKSYIIWHDYLVLTEYVFVKHRWRRSCHTSAVSCASNCATYQQGFFSFFWHLCLCHWRASVGSAITNSSTYRVFVNKKRLLQYFAHMPFCCWLHY